MKRNRYSWYNVGATAIAWLIVMLALYAFATIVGSVTVLRLWHPFGDELTPHLWRLAFVCIGLSIIGPLFNEGYND